MNRYEARVERERKRLRRKFIMLGLLKSVLAALFIWSPLENKVASDPEQSTSKTSMESAKAESAATDETSDEEEINDKKENREPMHVLLVGIDEKEHESHARTDTMMAAKYDPGVNEIRLASLMRDTYVDIPGYGENKLNAAYAYGGIELLEETVEKNYELDFDHYVKVNLDGFSDIVDIAAPDGLEVDIEQEKSYTDQAGGLNIHFTPGKQKLDGEETLKYVRFRSDEENDFGRVARQQEVLELLQNELLSFSTVARVPQLIGAIRPNLETDISAGGMLSLGRDAVTSDIKNIETLTVPVEGTYQHEYFSHAGSVLKIDHDETQDILEDFFSGVDPVDLQDEDKQEVEE
ncbi:LytR family transcriptional attenuator [Salsuginibacillus halophilus]|uniref:LytR family transcriptional attenuator n=1 Tax=Salsuginibacillus halophilus TaxID=517424 RepID=A0A2P8HXH5_9BACI|nr:LCP family protein [Salsuginibacillus halophilus]PSL50931.1 LytR family transcriptional attenuator [Salsuginibacillus halophilus]